MAYLDLYAMLGANTSATMEMMEMFKSSCIITTDNPPYDLEYFTSTFPVFPIGSNEGDIPTEIFNLFMGMANKSIKYDRFKGLWRYLMGLYIAHFLTLYLRTQAGEKNASMALSGALPVGLVSSKSVDGLSLGYDFSWANASGDLSGYGTWKETTYGQQLATLAKPYGHVGMWIQS